VTNHAHYDCPTHGTIAITWETTDVPIGPRRCVFPIPISMLVPINYEGLCGAFTQRIAHDAPEEN